MADFQIGDNLFSEDTGKYYNLNNGQKSYIKSPYETSQEKINQMYDAQQNSQLNTLKAQRDKAVGGFNQQKKDLTPQYASQRNQADVVNSQNVTRLRELMAANGINMSGENVTAQANMNSARQGSFNDINNNENQAMGAIDKQIANENDPSREQSINDAIAAERSKSLNDAFGQSQQQAYQQKMDWQNYQQQLAQQEQARKQAEFEQQQALKQAEFQQQQFAYQKQKDQQQLALSQQKAATAARTTAARTAAAKATKPTVYSSKSKKQSYGEALQFWGNQYDNISNQKAFDAEQALRNDQEQMNALQLQGYDINSVVDALYNVASQGKFQNKQGFSAYYNGLQKRREQYQN
jgi:hypothetical protein